MPRIPTYESDVTPTAESPNRRQELSVAASEGNDIAALAGGISDSANSISQRIQEAKDFQEGIAARVLYEKRLAELQGQAEQDGDNTGDLKPYQTEMQKLRAEVEKTVSNPMKKAEVIGQFELQRAASEIAIQNTFRKHIAKRGLADMETLLQNGMDGYAVTADDSYIKDAMDIIDSAAKFGYMDAEKAGERKKKAQSDYAKAAVYAQIEADPDRVDEILGRVGGYLDAKERVELTSTAKTMASKKQAEIKRQKEVAQRNVEMDLVQAHAKGELTLAMLDANSDVISPSFYKSLSDGLAKGASVSRPEKDKTYTEAIQRFYGLKRAGGTDSNPMGHTSGNKPEDVLAFRDWLVENSHKLDAADYQDLIKRTADEYNRVASGGDSSFGRLVANAVGGVVAAFSGGYALSPALRVFHDTLNKAEQQNPEAVKNAYRMAMRFGTYEANPVSMATEEPPNYTVSQGNISVAFPEDTDLKADESAGGEDMIQVEWRATGQRGSIPRSKFDNRYFKKL